MRSQNCERTNKLIILLSLFSITWVENTPLQKMIVNGLEAVSSIPCRNKFLLDTVEKILMFGNSERCNELKSVLTPKTTNTTQPNSLMKVFTFFLPKTLATPKPDNEIYIASTNAMANTREKALINPDVADVLNTIKHIGPTASCNNIPKRNPLKIIRVPINVKDGTPDWSRTSDT